MTTGEGSLPTRHEFTGPEDRFSEQRMDMLFDQIAAEGLLPETDKPLAITILNGADEISDFARALEYDKFDKVFKNNYEVMEEQYKRFDDQSVFIVLVDMANKRPAGVVRFITDGPEGLKTPADVLDEQLPWKADMLSLMAAEIDPEHVEAGDLEADQVLDVATMARSDKYDAHKMAAKLVSAALYREAYLFGRDNGYKTFVTIMDKKPYEAMQEDFKYPYKQLPGVGFASYLDSPLSVPCYCHIPTYEREMMAYPEIGMFIDTGIVARLNDGPGNWVDRQPEKIGKLAEQALAF